MFWAHVRMMPRLVAEEQVRRINDSSYAFGSMQADDGRNYVTDLRQRAQGDRVVAHRPSSMEEMQQLSRGTTTVTAG